MRKGELTRQSILDRACAVASTVGLEGLTIGHLSEELQLSKSGLFAHFKSKEALQVQTLEHAGNVFIDQVMRPALAAPRGEPRLRALFERWLSWAHESAFPGGCLFVSAATEYDDRPGPVRDFLVKSQRDWIDALAHAFRIGIAEGHFQADADPEQFAYDMYSIMLGWHHAARLMQDPRAGERARRSFENLIAAARRPARPASSTSRTSSRSRTRPI
jgi:AcrR family transcriptional regulator